MLVEIPVRNMRGKAEKGVSNPASHVTNVNRTTNAMTFISGTAGYGWVQPGGVHHAQLRRPQGTRAERQVRLAFIFCKGSLTFFGVLFMCVYMYHIVKI